MSNIILNLKRGKTLLVKGPHLNRDNIEIIDQNGFKLKSILMFAAGTGISPMLQIIDWYVLKYYNRLNSTIRKENWKGPQIYLVWVLKSLKHNYVKYIGLEKYARDLSGIFK